MGGGGGSTFSRFNPTELREQIRNAELEVAEREFTPNLAKRLNGLLVRVTDRDQGKIDRLLVVIKERLGKEIDDSFNLRFGGSVAKHTYVDGLSDVDVLLVMHSENDEAPKPREILNRIEKRLRELFKTEANVSQGRMAVTLTMLDGNELQIVPAIRDERGGLHVPEWRSDEWSRIEPKKFSQALTKRNEQCGMKLIPTIKLAKAINVTLPEPIQLSGYHIEAMAIAAFKNYHGPNTIEKMLPFFFKEMKALILTPIKDSTKQSLFVDEYLGRTRSDLREQISHVIDRISRRMENATAAKSIEQWNAIIGSKD